MAWQEFFEEDDIINGFSLEYDNVFGNSVFMHEIISTIVCSYS